MINIACVIVDFEDNIVVMKYVVICYKLNYLLIMILNLFGPVYIYFHYYTMFKLHAFIIELITLVLQQCKAN